MQRRSPTCAVELVTADGLHVVLDRRGWRCANAGLRERLERQVPLDPLHDDPLLAAAECASQIFAARIVQVRRTRMLDDLIAACQALTDSALQRVMLIAEDVGDHHTTAQYRQMRWNRLATLGLAVVAMGMAAVAVVYLMR